ncbi:MAG: hypothetical protein H0V82_04670 [Candidatus Protochlamydia sp.]|nr:hypothetical protein [Candidatus Protochlamydia sp.]
MEAYNHYQMCKSDLLDLIFISTPIADLLSCTTVCKLWKEKVQNNPIYIVSPQIIHHGFFGTSVMRNNEKIFLRMESITQENTEGWRHHRMLTEYIANGNNRGVLSGLLELAGTNDYYCYDDAKDATGFSYEEYQTLTAKLIELKKKTNNKIVNVVKANSAGSQFMRTNVGNFIIYASNNKNFSMKDTEKAKFNLKSYIEAYSNILISVGSDFSSDKESVHNRGIFRNPYWVTEEKYGGLSMLLFGMAGAVAEKFFPKKNQLRVKPLGSQQCILVKNLEFGEGYIIKNGEKKDITELEISPSGAEGDLNYIQIAALSRVFYEAVKK